MKILVTGAAGFIGMHVALKLLQSGEQVTGIDNMNDYYDVSLKRARLKALTGYQNFRFIEMDIIHREKMNDLFSGENFERVVHLAAQAGVRYSLKNPYAYIDSNIVGFLNILEGCRHSNVQHLVFASTSSVYGANTKMPFSVHDNVDHPVSLYAATKKSNELMAHCYSHLYGLRTSGLRFFTVYGPWGRPDMSPSIFARAIFTDSPIDVFNFGKMRRDFTYIDDIVDGVIKVLNHLQQANIKYDETDYYYRSTSHAHNLYLNVLAERGSVGFILLMAFLVYWAMQLFVHRPTAVDFNYTWTLWGSSLSAFVMVVGIGTVNTTLHHEHAMLSVIVLALWLTGLQQHKTS